MSFAAVRRGPRWKSAGQSAQYQKDHPAGAGNLVRSNRNRWYRM